MYILWVMTTMFPHWRFWIETRAESCVLSMDRLAIPDILRHINYWIIDQIVVCVIYRRLRERIFSFFSIHRPIIIYKNESVLLLHVFHIIPFCKFTQLLVLLCCWISEILGRWERADLWGRNNQRTRNVNYKSCHQINMLMAISVQRNLGT